MFFSQKSEKLVRVVIISLIFIMFPSISLIAGDKTRCPCKYKTQMIIGLAAAFDEIACYTGPGECDPRNLDGCTTAEVTVELWNEGAENETIYFAAQNSIDLYNTACLLEMFTNREQVIRPLSDYDEVDACLDEIYNACDVIAPGWQD